MFDLNRIYWCESFGAYVVPLTLFVSQSRDPEFDNLMGVTFRVIDDIGIGTGRCRVDYLEPLLTPLNIRSIGESEYLAPTFGLGIGDQPSTRPE